MCKAFKIFLSISLLGLLLFIVLSPVMTIVNDRMPIELFSNQLPLMIYLNLQFIAIVYLLLTKNRS